MSQFAKLRALQLSFDGFCKEKIVDFSCEMISRDIRVIPRIEGKREVE